MPPRSGSPTPTTRTRSVSTRAGNYSSARDLATLTRDLLADRGFAKIADFDATRF